jgi:hypothetical protein
MNYLENFKNTCKIYREIRSKMITNVAAGKEKQSNALMSGVGGI